MEKRSKPKGPKGSQSQAKAATDPDQITDPRFTKVQTSALYRIPSRKDTHVSLDSRFSHMLRDERFTAHAKVDRYGRRLQSQQGKKELERLYRIAKKSSPKKLTEIGSEDEQDEHELDPDEDVQAELARLNQDYDPAREGGFDESSSDESSSDDEQAPANGEEEEFLEQTAVDAPEGEVSSRLAVVNLDWDNVRAIDLMAVFTSFASGSGQVLKVTVYPSEFGKARMEKENLEGPPKDIFANSSKNVEADKHTRYDDDSTDEGVEEDDSEDERIRRDIVQDDQGEEFNTAQLRRYQLERLRYFYAVIECSSAACAKEVYDAVDGAEYLSSANFFDLRFIPDEMDFANDTPRDDCDRIPDRYRPNEFVTGALQHSKVKLSWDVEDPRRKEAQRRAFSGSRADIDGNDLKAYLASDTSSDDGDGSRNGETANAGGNEKQTKKEKERQRMRALLGLGAEPTAKSDEKGPVGDMQITFSSGLSEQKPGPIFETNSKEEETTIEKYKRKEKERQNKRKEKFKERKNDQPADDSAKSTNNKNATEEDLGFDDPFFTAPEKAEEAAIAARKEEKRKRRAEREAEEQRAEAQRAELELLLTDDHDTIGTMTHFDMQDLEKGEKALRKKKRQGKMSAREKQAVEAKQNDSFAMNLDDPRFKAIYERSEFAVDPSHPKFKETEGMQALLGEHRRKRAHADPDADGEAMPKKTKAAPDSEDKESLTGLLTRLKKKSVQRPN